MATQLFSIEHPTQIYDIKPDYYCKRLAVAGADKFTYVYEIQQDQSCIQYAALSGHTGAVFAVDWAHPRFGTVVASASFDGSVIIHKETNLEGVFEQIHFPYDSESAISDLKFCPQEYGLKLAWCTTEGLVIIHEFSDDLSGTWISASVESFTNHPLSTLSWKPFSEISGVSSLKLAVAGYDNAITILSQTYSDSTLPSSSTKEDKKISYIVDKTLEVPSGPVYSVDWMSNTLHYQPNLLPISNPLETDKEVEVLASCDEEGKLFVWFNEGDNNWKNILVYTHNQPLISVRFTPSCSSLVTSGSNGRIIGFKEQGINKWVEDPLLTDSEKQEAEEKKENSKPLSTDKEG